MSEGTKPDYEVFTVKDLGDDKKSIWTKVGAGWTHNDGEGINIQLDAIPVDGKLSIRKWKDKKED